MLTLIENGEVYAPEPRGLTPVLLFGDKIAKIGDIDRRRAESLGLPVEVIDAKGGPVIPGILDPHIHLTGGSGEEGFSSRSPELQLSEIIPWGITTVVGVLGVDATTRVLPALLAKVKGLAEQGLTGYFYTGYYDIPPATLTGSIRNDLMFIAEVIGLGEVAISDERSPQPDVRELARAVIDAKVGGMLSGKAGVTHFHMGELPEKMAPLRALLDDYHIAPELIYPSHVHRTPELLEEAVDLSKRGCFVDMDAADQDLGKWVRRYLEQGGRPDRLTLSSDSDSNSPKNLFLKWRATIQEHKVPFEQALPFVTSNTAKVLKLAGKGRLEPGQDADLVVLERDSLEIVEVIAQGKRMVRKRQLAEEEKFLEQSDREIELVGKK